MSEPDLDPVSPISNRDGIEGDRKGAKENEESQHRICREEISNLRNCVKQLQQEFSSINDQYRKTLNGLDKSVQLPGDESKQAKPAEKQSIETESNIDQKLTQDAILQPCVSIGVCDTEETFFRRKQSVHIVEILQEPGSRNSERSTSRMVGGLTNSTNDTTYSEMPNRIRIRSPLIIGLLEMISKSGFGPRNRTLADDPLVSVVFLYPFKLFVRHEADILREIKRIMHEIPQAASEESEIGVSQLAPIPARFQTYDAREHFWILETLLTKHLEPLFTIRRELRNQERNMITFEQLWLLFDSGDIVYEREPGTGPLSIPRLWKITQYGGGREILNDREPDTTDPLFKESLPPRSSKGKENVFCLRGFYLESNGKTVALEENGYTIPPWDGERSVLSLKLFPYKFCIPGQDFIDDTVDAWFNRLVREGRRYSRLKPGQVVYLKGFGVDENLKMSEYRSQVIIDFEQTRVDAPKLSQTTGENQLASLSALLAFKAIPGRLNRLLLVHSGDDREVEEFPENMSAVGPALRVWDIIHHDNSFDHEYFRTQLKDIAPISTFNTSDTSTKISRENFVLFPRIVSGFVLSVRQWVNFEMRDMSKARFNKGLWKELQLPVGYKRSLLATVRTHVRAKEPQFEYDSVPGKGAGAIILLQGSSGVGKTFTAEALSNHTNRPLYSITSGDLGDSVATVERQLAKILDHGRRWGCIILLDEADVYLTRRGQESFERNAIVSVFLRQLEWYPGLMVLTTNRHLDLDEAITQRFQLRLFYPPLNKNAVGRIWELYCTEEKCQQFIADRVSKKPRVTISDGVYKWWEIQYEKTTKSKQKTASTDEQNGQPWWSGRDIQFAFREVIALAVHDKVTQKISDVKTKSLILFDEESKLKKKKSSKTRSEKMKIMKEEAHKAAQNSRIITEEDEILITTALFDEVLNRLKSFDEGIKTMPNEQAGAPPKSPDEGLRYSNDDINESIIEESDVSSSDSTSDGDEDP